MNHTKRLTLWSCGSLISALALFLLVGCQSSKEQSEQSERQNDNRHRPGAGTRRDGRILVHTEGHPH